MMTEHAGADDGGFQRSIFRYTAAKEQGLGTPATNLEPIRGCDASGCQQTNIAVCYRISP